MKSLNQNIKIAVLFVLLGSSIHAWGYTSPIDGPTTETITNIWNLGANSLQVGLTTDGNMMIVTNGGVVVSGGGVFGRYGHSNSNRVIVTGTRAAWLNSGDIWLDSDYNDLLITNGGRVDNANSRVGGGLGVGYNLVTVSGPDSVWNNTGLLHVGSYLASKNAVVITLGGHLYSNGGELDCDQASMGGRVTVTGAGSIWENTGALHACLGGELLILNGGRVENTDALLDRNIYAEPSRVTGSGSTWINSGRLTVSGSELIISNGGHLKSNEGDLVFNPNPNGSAGKVTLTGAGSTWINSGRLSMGGGELVISDGGHLESGNGSVGGFYTEPGKVTVKGAGSTWKNTGSLVIRSTASIIVTNGGTASTASLALSSTNSEFHLQSGGKLAVNGDFDTDQPGNFDFSGGTLSVGGTLSNFFMLAAGCRLEASDLSGDLTVHGTFAPGQSPADTMLDGAFVLAGNGTLEMELAGYLPGTEYDHLTVTEASTLDGILNVTLLDNFSPVYGSTFDLFDWEGGVSGTFGATNLPTLEEGLGWDTAALYEDGTVAVVRRLPLDWQKRYNLPEDDPAGSIDSDGDGMDNYSEWKAGTDPTDPGSFFQVEPLTMSGAEITLRWNSLTNRTYRVEMSTNLLKKNAFMVIQSGIRGDDGNTEYTHLRDPGRPAAFYRTVIE